MATQGTYKGIPITAGTDAEVSAQIAKIDAGQTPATQYNVPTTVGSKTSYTSGTGIPETISSASLTPTPTLDIPTYQEQPASSFAEQLKQYDEYAKQATANEQSAVDNTYKNIEALFTQAGTEGARRGELETQAGLPDQQKQYNEFINQARDLQNQYESLGESADVFVENQYKRNAPMFAIQGAEAEARRQQTAAQRPIAAQIRALAAAADAVSGNMAMAQQNIERALDTEFGGIEKQIEYQKLVLDRNYQNLTSKQKEQADRLQIMLGERERVLEEEKANKKGVYDVYLAAAQNKADNLTLNRIRNAKTPEDAAQIAAESGFLISNKSTFEQRSDANGNLVEYELNPQGQVVDSRVISSKAPSGLPSPQTITDSSGNALEYGTPDYMIARLQQTAGSKTKLTQSEREQIGKFSNVVALTENLVGSLKTTTNDPLMGYLKSLNPYDFDARAVNAQVIALVPSVARGLYGEVGVLTDSDVERYLQTLPNIRSTKEQNKFIAMMTIANAKRSYEQTLLNAANSGVNVSGFVDSYKNMSAKLSQLEAELGVGGSTAVNVQQNIETEIGEDSFADTAAKPAGGFIGNFFRGLFGG